MAKKRYNARARTNPTVEIDNSSVSKVQIEIENTKETYDESNKFLIPTEKRKTKKTDKRKTITPFLSNKRRKQLEKVIERKEKKQRRAGLLEDLARVQVPAEELQQYMSITTIQTKGLKRHFQELNAPQSFPKNKKYDVEEAESIPNAIKGNKRIRTALLRDELTHQSSSDPNIVGFEEDTDSNEESSDNEEEEKDNEEEKEDEEEKEEDLIVEKVIDKNIDTIINKSDKNEEKKSTKDVTEVDKPPAKIIYEKIDRKPAVFVPVNRKPEIQEARLKLPVLEEEQGIVEAINENNVVIITGETGSGKTTQVPQFLYEAGYARSKMIGVTEPRRVAAMSMSKRVGEEMNLKTDVVSYLIRFEGNVTPETKIKFMTDGVLLKEVQHDFLLTKYSVIILDEAHERSVYTDILIGLLSRIVPLRAKKGDPLKLIIMSATLRVEDFVSNPKLFKIKPPVIEVASRQFPVTIHFNRKTSQNYVLDAVKKAVKIHTRLPEGGILIFLTGQHEVNSVVQKLRKAFPYKKKRWTATKSTIKNKDSEDNDSNNDDDDDDDEAEELNAMNAIRRIKNKRKLETINLPKINLDNYSAVPTDDTQEDFFDDDADDNDDVNLDEDEEEDEDILELKGLSGSQPMWVLPLYSLLPAHKQSKVFETVPEGCRLCVVSTNVAETSLTIPHIKYVIDSGRCKTRLYDKITGVTTFRVCYTSQAGANQRAGRAGRMGPGHCYRLYSSAVYNDEFEKFSEPEIRRKPVDDLLLQMKVMNIDKVINFPFPSAPDIIQLKSAEKRLCILGALEPVTQQKQSENFSAKVTPLGRSISAFPVAPRYGKMLALSQQQNLLKYTICMVSALSVQELLIESLGSEGESKTKWLQKRRCWAGIGNSLLLGDPMVLIRAVGAAEYAQSQGKMFNFCEENGLRTKAITEIRKLRQQLSNEIALNIPELDLTIDPNMPPPTDLDAKLLRQIVLSGMADHVAKRVSPDEIKQDEDKVKWRHAYKTLEMEDPVFMHSSCVLRKSKPEWVVYQEIYETNKMYMRGVTVIEPEWLIKFAPTLCRMNEPLDDPPPRYDIETGKVLGHMSGTFGRAAWELPTMEMEYPNSVDGVKYFARFFLEGQVCPKLKRFVPSLLSSPGTINKSWAELLPRTKAITNALLSKEVMSKEKLLEAWQEDKHFLLNAYQKWLPESAHSQVALIWPPV
ncbi:probable ATP-dependent RNA helicase kurz [Microplitis mediator]|uniref:probable ATP-dependent RNA helicase kurz n=1 Tax=Microplitis mediator TaxID=375433 RepID=UPI00255433DD|nr:probable ATP-dependent RNA helicase kurz [Microplitis mediator]